MPEIISLENCHVIYDQTCALDVERLSIEAGERVFVLGRSGSGKTTLCRVIKGRARPSTGRLRVLGRDPADGGGGRGGSIQHRIAMIDQEFFLAPRLRVIDNVLSGCLGRVSSSLSLLGWFPGREWSKAESILGEVELEGLANRRVETLSGGQRQRTAIGRALMQEAEVILADEPVSNLDPELAEDALRLLVECTRRRDVTLVVCLHQPSLARHFASRIIGLSEGRIVYDGPPEEFTEAKADFLYTGNVTQGGGSSDATDDSGGHPSLRLLDKG